jgi:hypothetical protein
MQEVNQGLSGVQIGRVSRKPTGRNTEKLAAHRCIPPVQKRFSRAARDLISIDS